MGLKYGNQFVQMKKRIEVLRKGDENMELFGFMLERTKALEEATQATASTNELARGRRRPRNNPGCL